MERADNISYEQLKLEGMQAFESIDGTQEQTNTDKIVNTVRHFFPGVKVDFDTDNDEIVLR
jgi:hypothetical protein